MAVRRQRRSRRAERLSQAKAVVVDSNGSDQAIFDLEEGSDRLFNNRMVEPTGVEALDCDAIAFTDDQWRNALSYPCRARKADTAIDST